MADWKKKNRVEDRQKVYIVKNNGDIKRALNARGWVENTDDTSPCFDFKWCLKPKARNLIQQTFQPQNNIIKSPTRKNEAAPPSFQNISYFS